MSDRELIAAIAGVLRGSDGKLLWKDICDGEGYLSMTSVTLERLLADAAKAGICFRLDALTRDAGFTSRVECYGIVSKRFVLAAERIVDPTDPAAILSAALHALAQAVGVSSASKETTR